MFARYHPSVLDQALVAKKLAATLGLAEVPKEPLRETL